MAEGTQNKRAAKPAKTFTHFMNGLRHGKFAPLVTDEWNALLREVNSSAIDNTAVVKGKLVITLGVTINALGEAQVVADVKKTAGKPKAVSNNYYVTEDGLSTEDPRQVELPLREVAPPRMRGEQRSDDDDETNAG